MNSNYLYNVLFELTTDDEQFDKLIEEMSELAKNIIKARQNKTTWNLKVAEEMADVIVVLESLRHRGGEIIDVNDPTYTFSDGVDDMILYKKKRLAKQLVIK